MPALLAAFKNIRDVLFSRSLSVGFISFSINSQLIWSSRDGWRSAEGPPRSRHRRKLPLAERGPSGQAWAASEAAPWPGYGPGPAPGSGKPGETGAPVGGGGGGDDPADQPGSSSTTAGSCFGSAGENGVGCDVTETAACGTAAAAWASARRCVVYLKLFRTISTKQMTNILRVP